jgi:hypothetical protein
MIRNRSTRSPLSRQPGAAGGIHLGPAAWFGLVCVAAGIAIPSTWLVTQLRHGQPVPAELGEQLLLGATLFRVCLALLGLLFVLSSGHLRRERGELDTHQAGRTGRPAVAALAVLLLAALGLRLYALGQGLWLDEIITYVTYVKSMPLGVIASTYTSENQHFLFSLAARAALLTFGDSAWSLRLPAVLFGVASIWALYRLGCEVTTRREAIFAAALMTFSYHHIWFSQNARGYTALLFWSILSSIFLVRGLRKADPKAWIWFAVAVALGMYTHTTMLFMVAGQFLIYLGALWVRRDWTKAQRWLPLWMGFGLSGLLTLLLYSFALPQFFQQIVETSTVPAWKNPLWTFFEFVRGIQLGFGSGLFLIPVLFVFALGVISYLRSQPVVPALLFLPVGLCTLVVVGLGHHLWPRFFFFAMGFGVLIAIRGTWVLAQTVAAWLRFSPMARQWAAGGLASAVVLASALSIPPVYGPKQDYAAAMAYIEEQRGQDDAVAVLGLANFAYRDLYATGWQEITSLDELAAARDRGQRTWVVYTFPPEVEAVYPEIADVLRREFILEHVFPGTVNHGEIVVMLAEPDPAQQAQRRLTAKEAE